MAESASAASTASGATGALFAGRRWPTLRFELDAALLFGVFFALAWAAIAVARQPGTVATVWVANGLASALIVSAPRERTPLLLGVVALANLAANLACGDPLVVSLAFLPANVLEVALAVVLMRPVAPRFAEGPGAYLQVVLRGAVLPPLLGATLGSAALQWLAFGRFERVWVDWYVGSLLGSVVALSFGLAWRGRGVGESLTELLQPRHLAMLSLSVVLTGLALAFLPYPLVWMAVMLSVAAYTLPRLVVFAGAFLVVATMAVAMALGHFVPSVGRSPWNDAVIYLSGVAVVLPAMVTAVAATRQRVLAEMLSAVGSRTGDIVTLVDMQGVYRWANRAREVYWGVPNREVIGRTWAEMMGHERFNEHVRPLLERRTAGATVRDTREIDYPGRGRRTMELTLEPAYDEDGHQLGVLSCASDITDLAHAQRELERRLAELRASHENLDQFVRIASHDLREPMNTIGQFVELIEARHGHQLDADARLYFSHVREGTRRMKTMLDDVLQFVRLEGSEPPPREPVDLDGVMREVRAALQARLEHSRGELSVAPLGTVWGHRSLIALVLQNLVSNGLKFVPPDRPPRVQVSATREGERLRLTVSDNGIGIEPHRRAELGTPFRRLHARRRFDGTGLGLAICKRIAAQHGGTLEIDSTPGEGSRFSLVLPERAAGRG